MDGSGSPVAPDSCDAEKMPSETHPDGCVVECPEVAEEDQAGSANATDTDAEGDPDASADEAATGSFARLFFVLRKLISKPTCLNSL